MKGKMFIFLLAAVLALGVTIGGTFIGGMAIGKAQGKEAATSRAPTTRAASTATPTAGQRFSGQGPALSQEQLQQLRQQFQGQLGQGTGGAMAGRGFTGALEKVEGNTVTVNTSQGPLQAVVDSDTRIQKFAAGTLADLQAGQQVTISGQRGEDGSVKATSITIVPEGSTGFMGPFGQGGQTSP